MKQSTLLQKFIGSRKVLLGILASAISMVSGAVDWVGRADSIKLAVASLVLTILSVAVEDGMRKKPPMEIAQDVLDAVATKTEQKLDDEPKPQ
jgi:hypothetical protein